MKLRSTCLLLALFVGAGAAQSADLATAQKQWDEKKFDEAFRNFKVLAEQGVPAAQLQLGEMYGFGEGTPEDARQAEFWLNKAAAAGQADAKESLALVQERQRRKADIAAYTTSFTGDKLAYANYHCVRPVFPAASKTRREVVAVNDAVQKWRDCYGTFATRLNGALPATNTIPPDVFKLMNNDEYQRAAKLIESSYARLAGEAQAVADQVAAENKTWVDNTSTVLAQNKAENDLFLAEQQRIIRANTNTLNNLPSGK